VPDINSSVLLQYSSTSITSSDNSIASFKIPPVTPIEENMTKDIHLSLNKEVKNLDVDKWLYD
jgi:hypothetical protein